MYGLQLVSASRRRLKRGTVYVSTLGRIGREGLYQVAARRSPAKTGGVAAGFMRRRPWGDGW